MPFYLRKVKRVNWDPANATALLANGDVPADALGDLRSSGNRLSVWIISDDKNDLPRIVAAFATSGDKLDLFDYCLIRQEDVDGKFTVVQCPGDTRDAEANETRHCDLIELSGVSLIGLARLMFERRESVGRYTEKQVRQFIAEAIKGKRFELESLSSKLRDAVRPLL